MAVARARSKDGAVWSGGVAYFPDPTRANKLLTHARPQQSFGYFGTNQSSRYLKIEGITSLMNGWLMMRSATITAVAVKSRSSGDFLLEIRKNDSASVLYTLNATNGAGVNGILDIDVNAGDFLQLYINGSAIDHPLAFIEIAWRHNI